jgi:hypothetical protein
LQAQLRQDLNTLEEESKMVYITSIEQLAKEEGMQAGMQQGLLKGKVQLLERQLWRRFGELPDWVHDHLSQADESKLDGWTDAVLTASSLDGVFASDSH